MQGFSAHKKMNETNKKIRCRQALTLLELVIAMAMLTIIFAVVVPQFAVIRGSWDIKQRSSEILQNGRVMMDHINRNLAKARQITAVSSSSIDFNDCNGLAWRYSVSGSYVQFGQPTGSMSDLAGPVSSLVFTCYDANIITPVAEANAVRLVKADATVTNSGQAKTFTTWAYLRTDPNTISITPDTTPPNPDPMTWAAAPAATGAYSITMTATTATDDSGVEYYFDCLTAGGHDSGWTDNPVYQDTGLNANTSYTYRVQARDKSPAQNATDWSTSLSATTQQAPAISAISSWVIGTSHDPNVGNNRALIFIAHASNNGNYDLTSVTYGGQTMTNIVSAIHGTGNPRMYTGAFILNEAGIAAATSNIFVPTWSSTPSSVSYSSVFLQDVNQTTLTGNTASATATTGATITTSALANATKDLIIDAATCSNTGTYTVNNGFTKAYDLGVTGIDGVAGWKSATGANETPSVTHSTSNGRQSLIGFVVKGGGQ
jgi:hypothetical protein